MIVNPGSGAGKNGAPAKHAAQHGKNGTDHVTPASIGAAAENHSHSKEQVGAAVDEVLAERTINGKPLNEDVTLTASDVKAAQAGHTHTPAEIGAAEKEHAHTGYAPASHTHTAAEVGAAEEDHTHTAAEVGAAPSGHTHTAGDVGAAAANHTHTPASIGAAAANHTHTPASIGAAASSHSHSGYASTSHTHTAADVGALPSSGGTLTGDLRIKGSGNFGTKINLGDGDYVHISEPTDDCMEIKAKKINFVTTDTTDAGFTLNGEKIGGGASVEPAATAPKAPGTAAAGTSAKYAREDHVHPSQTSVSGNAGSATKLATARTIDGVSFNGSAAITHYGVCNTAEATYEKVVSCQGFTLVTGARIAVKFTNGSQGKMAALNVNNTGAKEIRQYGNINSLRTDSEMPFWQAGEVIEFIYDGSGFVVVDGRVRSAANNAVKGTRTINGHSLSSNITLTAEDVGAVSWKKVANQRAIQSGKDMTVTGIDATALYLIFVLGCGTAMLVPGDIPVDGVSTKVLLECGSGNIFATRPATTSLKITNSGVGNTVIMDIYKIG